MPRLGIALSGGGFRATLYHLGVVRFLRDANALQYVEDIASVSGGSILAAHLVLNWDRYNGSDEDFAKAASEIVKFVQFDLRNHIARRMPLQWPLRALAKLPILDGRNFTANAILEKYYRKYLYGDRCLYELRDHPALHILATCVSTGALSVFNRDGLYLQQRSTTGLPSFDFIPGQLATLAQIVGASSAFPGFFPPVKITAADLGVREGQFPTEFFTDGGVYDNLGLRAFLRLQKTEKEFDHILVSDAGKPFQILSDAALGFIGQSVRATDILWDRVWQLEHENFGQQDGFSFLPITEAVDLAEDPLAMHPIVQGEAQTIRTDLDRFSNDEINTLAQHGYEVARKVCRKNSILSEDAIPMLAPWIPIANKTQALHKPQQAPAAGPAPATTLSRQLRASSRRRIWSTLLDPRDWTSYLYVAIALVLFGYLPFRVYRLRQQTAIQTQIIKAIASGDPDIHQILELATSNPIKDWQSHEIQSKPEATEVDYEGLEVLTHSRIYDLRWWNPDEESLELQGHVYVRDRISFQLLDSYQGDGRVVFRFPSKIEAVQFQTPSGNLQGTISRIEEPIEIQGQQRTLFEFEYDVSQVPPSEPVTIEVELMLQYPKTVRAPFMIHAKTDLISVWLLFPTDRPYRTYSLVSYPLDHSQPPRLMNNRYSIDHPYGSLIGWSVVNPELDRIYECRWTTE